MIFTLPALSVFMLSGSNLNYDKVLECLKVLQHHWSSEKMTLLHICVSWAWFGVLALGKVSLEAKHRALPRVNWQQQGQKHKKRKSFTNIFHAAQSKRHICVFSPSRTFSTTPNHVHSSLDWQVSFLEISDAEDPEKQLLKSAREYH